MFLRLLIGLFISATIGGCAADAIPREAESKANATQNPERAASALWFGDGGLSASAYAAVATEFLRIVGGIGQERPLQDVWREGPGTRALACVATRLAWLSVSKPLSKPNAKQRQRIDAIRNLKSIWVSLLQSSSADDPVWQSLAAALHVSVQDAAPRSAAGLLLSWDTHCSESDDDLAPAYVGFQPLLADTESLEAAYLAIQHTLALAFDNEPDAVEAMMAFMRGDFLEAEWQATKLRARLQLGLRGTKLSARHDAASPLFQHLVCLGVQALLGDSTATVRMSPPTIHPGRTIRDAVLTDNKAFVSFNGAPSASLVAPRDVPERLALGYVRLQHAEGGFLQLNLLDVPAAHLAGWTDAETDQDYTFEISGITADNGYAFCPAQAAALRQVTSSR